MLIILRWSTKHSNFWLGVQYPLKTKFLTYTACCNCNNKLLYLTFSTVWWHHSSSMVWRSVKDWTFWSYRLWTLLSANLDPPTDQTGRVRRIGTKPTTGYDREDSNNSVRMLSKLCEGLTLLTIVLPRGWPPSLKNFPRRPKTTKKVT